MHWTSALESAIQISIAICSFSGIVAAVGRRATGRWTSAEQFLLRQLLTASGATLLFAYFPFVLLDAIPEPTCWRIVSGLLAIWRITIIVRSFRQMAAIADFKARPAVGTVPGLVIALALVANVGLALPWLYVVGVLWGLIVAFGSFVSLLLDTWKSPDEPDA